MQATHSAHPTFPPQLRSRLKTVSMGLGLVRLLLAAGRTTEAQAILATLQNSFQDANQRRKPRRPKRRSRGTPASLVLTSV